MLSGIDVSNWEQTIAWDAVAASGIQWAICKCSEGTTYADPTFPTNWNELGRVGLLRGAYHFARPERATPDADAAYFLKQLSRVQLAPGDVVALDVETGSGDLAPWVLTWLRTVEAALGFKPIIYSGVWFMVPNNLTDNPALAQYGLWLAAYQATMPQPPSPWPVLAIWQHDDKGSVPGITGPVDLDVFNGTVEQFKAYGKPVAPPPPDPTATLVLQITLGDAQYTATLPLTEGTHAVA